MPAFITFGRVLFAVLFIVSGATKLFDLPKTADMINAKVVMTLPAMAAPYKEQVETLTGMESKQLLAIIVGAVELVSGLLIAINFGTRFFAMVLVLFVLAATFYFHDFWNQSGQEATGNVIQSLKNLSLIGGLFVLAGIGPRSRSSEPNYTDV